MRRASHRIFQWYCHSPLDGESTAAVPFFLIGRLCLFPSSPFSLEGGTVIPRFDGESKGLFCSFFSSVRRTNQEEPPPGIGLFRSLADASLGGCGTRCAHTVLALFPAFGCRPPGPIRAVSLFSLFVCLCLFPFCSLLTSLDSRSTGNPRRWLCFVMTGGILGGCTSQWAKSIPHLNVPKLFLHH